MSPEQQQLEAGIAALEAERALLGDAVGSTRLSERLDPEAISAVMDDALARGAATAEALGDPRAAGLLASAHKGLQTLAELYADVVPQASFLAAAATAREIRAAWAEAGAG